MSENENIEETQEEVKEEKETEEEESKPELTDEQKKGIRLRNYKKLKKEFGEEEKPEPEKKEGFDYGVSPVDALLSGKGIPEEDWDMLKEEAKTKKEPITEVLKWKHIQEKLETSKQERTNKDALPKGSKRGSAPTKNVDYWIKAGKLPEDPMLKREVVREKIKLEKQKEGGFYNS